MQRSATIGSCLRRSYGRPSQTSQVWMFPFILKRSQTWVPLIICEAKGEKGAHLLQVWLDVFQGERYCVGDRPQIISDTRFHLKNVLIGSFVMVGKVELDSTFPIIQTVCRRSPQTPGTNGQPCSRPIADRCRSYGNQAFTNFPRKSLPTKFSTTVFYLKRKQFYCSNQVCLSSRLADEHL